MADAAARNASKRERKRRAKCIAPELANRRIDEAFCGDEARVAAFTSSESFPSTFQIMRERNPPPLPESPLPPQVSCPGIRVGTYHATRRARENPLYLYLSFSPHTANGAQQLPFYRRGEERRDPRDRITRYRRSHFRSCATWMHRTRPMIARRLSLFRRRLDISGAMLAKCTLASRVQLWSHAWANRERRIRLRIGRQCVSVSFSYLCKLSWILVSY